MPIDPKTLTTEKIIADLIDAKSTPLVIQQEAGKRMTEMQKALLPMVITTPKITPEEKKELEEREKLQNAPKNYTQIQLLSIPMNYLDSHPELFRIINKKGNSKENEIIEIAVGELKFNCLFYDMNGEIAQYIKI
jgi:hypothetical protein